MTGPLVGVSRAVVGAAHVTACVVLLVAFFVTGAGLLLALAGVAAAFAWWLLRDARPACAHTRVRRWPGSTPRPAYLTTRRSGSRCTVRYMYDDWCEDCDRPVDWWFGKYRG